MKKFSILLITLLMVNGAIAQSCLPQGIHFYTQAQIDSFPINYPNCTQIEGFVDIAGGNIINLYGLSVLTTIGGDLSIECTYALTSLIGLENLTTIGGDLYFNYNDALTSLTGLENLTTIGGYLDIEYNWALNSLWGLDNVTSIGDLYIAYNYSLSTCAIQSICEYLASPNGTIEIHNNAPGCDSKQEVEAACGVGMEENNQFDNHLNIFPNPAYTNITVETITKGHLYIHNINDQQLLQQEITEPTTTIDVRTLTSGFYVVRLTGERTVQVGKFVRK
jgi:hypothetical protein